jgi:hypothetical protein
MIGQVIIRFPLLKPLRRRPLLGDWHNRFVLSLSTAMSANSLVPRPSICSAPATIPEDSSRIHIERYTQPTFCRSPSCQDIGNCLADFGIPKSPDRASSRTSSQILSAGGWGDRLTELNPVSSRQNSGR